MKNLDEAILWFRTCLDLKVLKYRNRAGKIRFRLVYDVGRPSRSPKLYELARGNSLWEALLKAYTKVKEGSHWSIVIPRLQEANDVVILDPSLKKKPKLNRKVRL